MPFTPSHAVIALPFVRTPLLPAGIAIGSMAPDLPLFVRGTPLTYQVTHTNVLVSSLVAVALLTLWYVLLRPAVRELSPAWLARRLPSHWDATAPAAWRAIAAGRSGVVAALWVALSIVLGVVSHIVWDGFTHVDRAGVILIPALDEAWGPLVGYKWLQYGSGVLGLLILALAGAVWLRARTPVAISRALPRWVVVAWWVALPLLLTVAWTLGMIARGAFTATRTPLHLAHLVLPSAVALWGLLTVVICGWVLARRC